MGGNFEGEDDFSGFGQDVRLRENYGFFDWPVQEVVFAASREVVKGGHSPQTVTLTQIWPLLSK